jgi:probable HAF family extracellular repeat protein
MVAATVFAAFLASALLIICTSFGVPQAAAETTPEKPVYTVRGLGTLGGTQSIARDINDSGQVVGQSQNASGQNRGFFWQDDGQGMKPIGTLGV